MDRPPPGQDTFILTGLIYSLCPAAAGQKPVHISQMSKWPQVHKVPRLPPKGWLFAFQRTREDPHSAQMVSEAVVYLRARKAGPTVGEHCWACSSTPPPCLYSHTKTTDMVVTATLSQPCSHDPPPNVICLHLFHSLYFIRQCPRLYLLCNNPVI